MANIRRISSSDADFRSSLGALLAWEAVSDARVETTVREVLADVRARGDRAVIEYTNRFDNRTVESVDELEIPLSRCRDARESIAADHRAALEMSTLR